MARHPAFEEAKKVANIMTEIKANSTLWHC